MTDNAKWGRHFIDLALVHARMSKDPSTKIGAIIVGPDRELRSAGFNGFPRGIADTPERLADRDMKLRLVVHAEMNAVLAAARVGIPLKGCTLYLAATDVSGQIWGGAPCTRCSVEMLQAGIVAVVSPPLRLAPSRWRDDCAFARDLWLEAGLECRGVEID